MSVYQSVAYQQRKRLFEKPVQISLNKSKDFERKRKPNKGVTLSKVFPELNIKKRSPSFVVEGAVIPPPKARNSVEAGDHYE